MASKAGMASTNGKGRNGSGYAKGKNPKSLANLKPIKPGQVLAKGPKKPRGFMGYLREALGDQVKTQDGRTICREQAMAELLVRRSIRQLGVDPATGEPREWCKSIDHVLNRISPVPRSPDVEIERAVVATVNGDGVSVAFLQKVREFSGDQEVGPDDVLGYMDGDIDIRVGKV